MVPHLILVGFLCYFNDQYYLICCSKYLISFTEELLLSLNTEIKEVFFDEDLPITVGYASEILSHKCRS